jgi:hypothetical protein
MSVSAIDLFEAVKTVGSFVGLLAGIAVLYDRLARGRPCASLTISVYGGSPSPRIRVNNTSPYDIAVVDITVHPETYLTAESGDAEDRLRAARGQRPYFMLKPDEQKEIWILPKFENSIPLEIIRGAVAFRIWWRRGNATWLPQVPVTVRTSTETIRKFGLEKPDISI